MVKKHFLWCFEILHPDGTGSIHYFEANSFDSFPNIEGRFVNVEFKTISIHENS